MANKLQIYGTLISSETIGDLSTLSTNDKSTIVGAINEVAQSNGSLPTGGAAHQMLVTDADGNALWEDRTHYTEAVNAEVIPETEWVNNEGQFVLAEAPTNQPVIGVNHTVVYNGVSYDCVGVAWEEDGMVSVALGNTYVLGLGGAPSEVPFVVLIIPLEEAAETGMYGLCLPMDGAESVTMSIKINDEVVHPLDEKYIPDSVTPKNTNLVNGAAKHSLRSTDAAETSEQDPHGVGSVAIGYNAVARGKGSLAYGNSAYVGSVDGGLFDDNIDSGVAFGSSAQAGRSGFACGVFAKSTGYDSMAIGDYAEATGSASTAVGYRAIAAGNYQTVVGAGNLVDNDGKYCFIVGKGKEYEYAGFTRSNAHTVDWDGNAWFAGDVYIGGTSQDDGAEMLATEAYVDEKVTGLATEAYVGEEIAALVESAPETLNTLNELAAALGDDPNFATTVTTQLSNKVDKTTTVNDKTLSSNITLSASDVGAVPTTRTVNGKALSANITLKASDLENDAGYLTEHQDISGKLDADELPEAVNDALAQAKASGEFDGADGVGIVSVEQTTTSTDDGGKNVITVTKTDNTTSTFTVYNGSKGSTPVKGTDYWTAADQASMVQDVLAALPTWEGGSY